MLRKRILGVIVAGGITALAMGLLPINMACGAEPQAKSAKQLAREHWENVVLFFGDEETGEWSIRIRDQDVHNRGRFEYLELWQFERASNRWVQIKTEKFAKAIVLPSQKRADDPVGNQSLVELKEIEPRTAGIGYAKWKIDDVEGGTLMRVGTAKTSNHIDSQPPSGMIKMVVPIDLNKSETMIIP